MCPSVCKSLYKRQSGLNAVNEYIKISLCVHVSICPYVSGGLVGGTTLVILVTEVGCLGAGLDS